MRDIPTHWDTYTQKQREEFYHKTYQERREIINKSYLSLITDKDGNLDTIKILEIIMDLQDRVDDLENVCVRENYD